MNHSLDLDGKEPAVFDLLHIGIIVLDSRLMIRFRNRWIRNRTPEQLKDESDFRGICRQYQCASALIRIEQALAERQPVILTPAFHDRIVPLWTDPYSKQPISQQGFVRPIKLYTGSPKTETWGVLLQIIDVSNVQLQLKELEDAIQERQLA
jgi:hypothetical protein